MNKLLACLLAIAALTGTTAGARAAPANDAFANATEIGAAPFTDSLNTLTATTEPDDPSCSGNGASVWYTYTPAANRSIEVDTFGSSYDTTLSAYVMVGTSLEQVACNDDASGLQSRIQFNATKNTTYYFMVASLGGGEGGDLRLSFKTAAPILPLTVDVRIDPTATYVRRTGVYTFTGLIRCSAPAALYLRGEWLNKVGRLKIRNDFYSSTESCGRRTRWTAVVAPGTFVASPKLFVSVQVEGQDPLQGGTVTDNATRVVTVVAR